VNKKIVLGAGLIAVLLIFGYLLVRDDDTMTRPLSPSAEILFTSNQDTGGRREEIYTMDADGGDVTRVTFTEYHHFIVGIDGSGRYLAVTRADRDTEPPQGIGGEDGKSLWVIDLETGDETRLTGEHDEAEGDSFSPDGEWLVFWMIPEGEATSDIYKIRKNGSGLTRLTDTPDANEFDPQWSNTGDEIAFISYGAGTPRFVLRLMDSDGGEPRTIYDGGDTVSTPYFPPGVFDPSWSPDDQWIVFEKPTGYDGENGNAGVWHIFKIRRDGTGLVDLSEAGGHGEWAEYLPSYSGDGGYIVFTARYGSPDLSETYIDVFRMDKDGGSLLKLTDNPAYNEFAVWVR
jgi:Tol biopolymer transport system component